MNALTYLPALLLFSQLLFSQTTNFTSNTSEDITKYLSGVKYAYIELDEKNQQRVNGEGSVLLSKFSDYLYQLGFEKVVLTTEDKNKLLDAVPSLCDMVKVKLEATFVGQPKNYFTNHVVRFKSCKQDTFHYHSDQVLYNDPTLLDKMYEIWNGFYHQPIQYNELNRQRLHPNTTNWNEQSVMNHMNNYVPDRLEGIYRKYVLSPEQQRNKYRIAIIKDVYGYYDIIYLDGANNYIDWQQGELIGKIKPTGLGTLGEVQWYRPDKTIDDQVMLSIDGSNMLYLTYIQNGGEKVNYYKEYPSVPIGDGLSGGSGLEQLATGSGTALTTNGYILTNYHVIEGGTMITAELERDGIPRTYKTEVVQSDKNLDLAVLKIDDSSFTPFTEIPYNFQSNLAPVGTNVFTLGFPLTSSMGYEIKLTTGTISAHTGYEGDVTSYQIQAPVQPGNSGGPLFDNFGNLIGIIKAKHNKAEIVTYAIKSLNILNLVHLLGSSVKLPSNKSLRGMELAQQKLVLDDYVFFLRVYH